MKCKTDRIRTAWAAGDKIGALSMGDRRGCPLRPEKRRKSGHSLTAAWCHKRPKATAAISRARGSDPHNAVIYKEPRRVGMLVLGRPRLLLEARRSKQAEGRFDSLSACEARSGIAEVMFLVEPEREVVLLLA
jgi:hypothetical protein